MIKVPKKFQMGSRWVGGDEPIFIVVETGTTCNGDLKTALQMVDAAKEANADAIKFMIIDPDYFMSDKTVTYNYEWSGGKAQENMYEMFKKLKFSLEEWQEIITYAKEKGLIAYATIDYVPGVDLGLELNLDAYKISSWDVRHYPLAKKMGETGKPVQVDLGPATLIEIQKLLEVIYETGNDQVLLVHCSHAKVDHEVHINTIPYLQDVFGQPVGYSADSQDFTPDLLAIASGCHLIEKRLTLKRDYEGHHHIKALEPQELIEWVQMVRRAETLMGKYGLEPSTEDLRQKELYFVSLVADQAIPAGTTITEDMLACKRPGHGLSPDLTNTIVGRQASCDIEENQLLSWDMF